MLGPAKLLKTVTACIDEALIGTDGREVALAYPQPPRPSENLQTDGRISLPFELQPNGWSLTNMSLGTLFHNLLLPLDKAVASRAVSVIVSWSDRRADRRAGGRTETLLEPSQLNNSKTVRYKPYVPMGS